MKKALSLLLIVAMALSICSGIASAETPDWALDFSDVNAWEMPPVSKKIVYAEGTWYEMGVQYAQQVPDIVMRSILYAGGNKKMATYGGPEGMAADEDWQTKLANINAAYPEVVELWHGIADGMGIPFEWIGMAEGRISAKVGCSHVAAWGEATADGSMVCGSNYDMPAGATLYYPTVVARPAEGNAFICAEGFANVAAMNDKGVCTFASAGQNGAEGDRDGSIIGGGGYCGPVILSRASSPEEARDEYLKNGPGNGENFHCIGTDVTYVVEHTAAKDSVRMGIENDEGYEVYGNNYTVSANGFLTQPMQDSMETFWLDNLPRYWTEEEIVLEDYGFADINTINNALACTKAYIPENWEEWITENNITWFVGDERETALNGAIYDWDGETTGWIDFDWNPAGVGLWSPENRTIDYGATSRMLAEPEKLNCYLMVGMRDTINCKNPGATGTFCKLHLGDSTADINNYAGIWAEYMIFYASRDVSRAGSEVDAARLEALDLAKTNRLAGFNYTSLAQAATDENEARNYYSLATTAYCAAQCYAEMAFDDPTQIVTDDNIYYFMG